MNSSGRPMLRKLDQNQAGFGIFGIIIALILIWAAWVTIQSILPEPSAEPTQSETVSQTPIESSDAQFQQISLVIDGFSGSANATRFYEFDKGYEMKVIAALPNLPEEVHYQAYFSGRSGTLNLGRMIRDGGAFRASHKSSVNQFDDYDSIDIRVEGANGEVEGRSVPFSVASGQFPEYSAD